MKNKITMQEIADMLGVSKVTVSKALNNKDGVGTELKNRILGIAREYGYRLPERSAGEGRQNGNVIVFCDNKFFDVTGRSHFYAGIYNQISRELLQRGFMGTLFTLEKERGVKEAVRVLAEGSFDGMILLGILERDFLEVIRKLEIPKVFVDSDSGGMEGDSVLIENFYTTCRITEILLDKGHTQVGFVGNIHATASIRDRFLGYCRAMIGRNNPIRQEWLLADRSDSNVSEEIVLPETLPTAFVCNCDDTAYRLIRQLRAAGLRVPEDVSIVSFDDDILAQICEPPLTTVSINMEMMAQKAADLITLRIGGGMDGGNVTEQVDGTIIFRESVREAGE